MDFIGRKSELKRLDRFKRSPQPQIAVVYGRRRVGKSLLIRKALQDTPALFFEALEERSKREQINHFMRQLRQFTGQGAGKPTTWTEALLELFEAVKEKPRALVFDEFQWMANYRHDLVSELKYVWDQFFAQLPGQKLVLCGSIASFMIDKVIKSRALYGRIDVEIGLQPFMLAETRQMLSDKGMDEILDAHLLTGGVPKYLQLMHSYSSIHLALRDLSFQRDAYFTTEYQRIFVSHFGKTTDFATIVQTLAAHPLGLLRDALIRKTKTAGGGRLTERLRDLESAGFLKSDTPFNRGLESRQIKYFLSDAYLRFYFAFIHPNLRKIQDGQGANILTGISDSGALNAWMGRSFEYLCVQHALEIASLIGFSAVDFAMGPYFAAARTGKPGVQIDLIFDRADNVINLCEIKHSRNTVGVEVITEVRRKIELLKPIAGKKTIQPVLIVRNKPSQALCDQGFFYRIIEADELLKEIN